MKLSLVVRPQQLAKHYSLYLNLCLAFYYTISGRKFFQAFSLSRLQGKASMKIIIENHLTAQ